MNNNLVGQQTTGNVQLQLWHRWQRGLQLESDFFEKNTKYLKLQKCKYHTKIKRKIENQKGNSSG